MSSCEVIRSRLEELRVDLLPPPERDVAEAHLSACPACASRWKRIQEVEKALIECAEPLDVGKVRDLVRHAKNRVARERRRKEILPMAAAAFLLLSILAWLTGLPGVGTGPARPQEAFEEKRLGIVPPGAGADIVWSPDGRRWACRMTDKKTVTMGTEGAPRVKEIKVARVTVEGRPGKDFTYVGVPSFSADGRKVAYVAADEPRKLFVVVVDSDTGETTRGESYEEITTWSESDAGSGHTEPDSFKWSPTGASLAYVGRRGNQVFAVVDGTRNGPHDRINDIAWSPDARAFAYIAGQGEDWFVVRDGKRGEVFDQVSQLTFSPDGRSLAFVAKEEGVHLIWENKRGPAFLLIGRPVFSPDGKRLAYRTVNQVVVDDFKGTVYKRVGDPVFSPDGTRVAYRAQREDGAHIITVEGRLESQGERFQGVGDPVFSPDGKSLAYSASRGGKEQMIVAGRPGEKFSKVGAPVFSPDGRVVAYGAERYGKAIVVVGDKVGEECDRVLWGPVFSADGKKVSYRALKGEELWSKVVDVP